MRAFFVLVLLSVFFAASVSSAEFSQEDIEAGIEFDDAYCFAVYGPQSGMTDAMRFKTVDEARANTTEPVTLDSIGCLLLRYRDLIRGCVSDKIAERHQLLGNIVELFDNENVTYSQANKKLSEYCVWGLGLALDSFRIYNQLVDEECSKTHSFYCRALHSNFLNNIVMGGYWPRVRFGYDPLLNTVKEKISSFDPAYLSVRETFYGFI